MQKTENEKEVTSSKPLVRIQLKRDFFLPISIEGIDLNSVEYEDYISYTCTALIKY